MPALPPHPPVSLPADNSNRIQNALYSFMTSQLLFVALDLDIFTLIEAGVNAPDKLMSHFLASSKCMRKPASTEILRQFLDGLVGAGLLYKSTEETYSLPGDVQRFLTQQPPPAPANPYFMGGMVAHCRRLYELWSLLPDVLYSGMPAGGAHQLAEAENRYAELAQALYASNRLPAEKLAGWLTSYLQSTVFLDPDVHSLNVVDLAGGTGVWSMALLQALAKSPKHREIDAKATIVDYDTVLEVTQHYAERAGLAHAVRLQAGDLETMTLPSEQYDLAFLAHICHVLGEEASQTLIQQAARTLKPKGILVIIDFMRDNARSNAGWPLLYSLNLRVTTPAGRVFRAETFRSWLNQAGLKTVTRFEIEPDVWALVAQK
ncbi:MAG: class I SAM-dependent methyltransferase [Vampirovibrionales bacterium]|nr:class I SAM-dependent methyltransferase [Vampirovibrionales bacterium]